jgi:hypothetical protein
LQKAKKKKSYIRITFCGYYTDSLENLEDRFAISEFNDQNKEAQNKINNLIELVKIEEVKKISVYKVKHNSNIALGLYCVTD